MILSRNLASSLGLCLLVMLIFSGIAGQCQADNLTTSQATTAQAISVPTSLPAKSLMTLEQVPPEFVWPIPGEQGARTDPGAMALYLEGRALYRRGDVSGAIDKLQQALQQQSDNFQPFQLS